MAEATQEQMKTNQLLEKSVTSATEQSEKISELIEAVKQPGQTEEILSELKDQNKDHHATIKKKHKKDEKLQEEVENLSKDLEEARKVDGLHKKFMEDAEKKKEGLAKAALADKKREDKFSTRMAKGAWDWTKNKVGGVVKATGSFLSNMMKLLGLVALWFALSWLKGKNLKKMFEDFMKKVNEIIDDWIPQWIKDLSALELLGLGIGSLVAGWLVLKGAVASAGWALRRTGARIVEKMGVKSPLNKSLIRLTTQLDDLVAKRNAIKSARKMAVSLEAKSALNEELKKTNQKIAELEQQIKNKQAAAQRAADLAENLKDNGKISKELKKANKELKKATAKNTAITESVKWSKNFDINSKLGKELQKANAEFAAAQQKQKQLIIEKRTNAANRALLREGKATLGKDRWVDKAGNIREGGVGVGEEGTGKVVKKSEGGGRISTTATDPTFKEKAGNWWNQIKARFGAGAEKIGEMKIGGKSLKTIFAGGGWMADLAWRATKILEPFRGFAAGRLAAEERGEGFWGQLRGAGEGTMHGGADLIGEVVKFMGDIGKWSQEGGIRGLGILRGDSEAKRDRMVKEMTESAYNPFHWITEFGEGIQNRANDAFGTWEEGTKIQERMAAAMGTEGEFSMGDIVGLGDAEGFFSGMNKFWTAYFSLRQNDVRKEVKEKLELEAKEEAALIKSGKVKNWAGRWVDAKDADKIIRPETMEQLEEVAGLLKQFMIETAKQGGPLGHAPQIFNFNKGEHYHAGSRSDNPNAMN